MAYTPYILKSPPAGTSNVRCPLPRALIASPVVGSRMRVISANGVMSASILIESLFDAPTGAICSSPYFLNDTYVYVPMSPPEAIGRYRWERSAGEAVMFMLTSFSGPLTDIDFTLIARHVKIQSEVFETLVGNLSS